MPQALTRAEYQALKAIERNTRVQYRRKAEQVINTFWASDPVKRDLILERLKRMDVDAIKDMQLGGNPKCFSNFRLVDQSVNRSVGKQVASQIKNQ